jgi:hypothetical protein
MMKKFVTFRWSLVVPVCALLFWCSDASAQSQEEKDANFAKYALKLREGSSPESERAADADQNHFYRQRDRLWQREYQP